MLCDSLLIPGKRCSTCPKPPSGSPNNLDEGGRPSLSNIAAWYGAWYILVMDQRLGQLLDLLDQTEGPSASSSVRLPETLRKAAVLAVAMGYAESASALTVGGLRRSLEAVAQQAILDAHYEQHPEARPSLAELALAAAQLDGNPLTEQQALIHRAADEIVVWRPDADADDVLLFAAGLASAAA